MCLERLVDGNRENGVRRLHSPRSQGLGTEEGPPGQLPGGQSSGSCVGGSRRCERGGVCCLRRKEGIAAQEETGDPTAYREGMWGAASTGRFDSAVRARTGHEESRLRIGCEVVGQSVEVTLA